MTHEKRQRVLDSAFDLDQYEGELDRLRLAMIEPAPRISVADATNPFSGKPYAYAPSEYDPQRERFLQVRRDT